MSSKRNTLFYWSLLSIMSANLIFSQAAWAFELSTAVVRLFVYSAPMMIPIGTAAIVIIALRLWSHHRPPLWLTTLSCLLAGIYFLWLVIMIFGVAIEKDKRILAFFSIFIPAAAAVAASFISKLQYQRPAFKPASKTSSKAPKIERRKKLLTLLTLYVAATAGLDSILMLFHPIRVQLSNVDKYVALFGVGLYTWLAVKAAVILGATQILRKQYTSGIKIYAAAGIAAGFADLVVFRDLLLPGLHAVPVLLRFPRLGLFPLLGDIIIYGTICYLTQYFAYQREKIVF